MGSARERETREMARKPLSTVRERCREVTEDISFIKPVQTDKIAF